MATVQGMLDALADERDRLSSEVDGVQLAIDANCSAAVLTTILLPFIGTIIGLVAKAACAIGNTADLQRRIAVVESLIGQIEALADRVKLVNPNDAAAMASAERDVLSILARTRNVEILSDTLDTAARAVRDAIANVGKGLQIASGVTTAVAIAAVVIVGALSLRR